jgi:hypothetical protein
MEELTDNAEEQEDEGSKQSEQKLGKLQYKVSGWGRFKAIEVYAPRSQADEMFYSSP